MAEGMTPSWSLPGLWGGQWCIRASGGAEEGERALPAPQGCSLALSVPLVPVPGAARSQSSLFQGSHTVQVSLQMFPT